MDKKLIYVCSPYQGWQENYEKAQCYGSYVFSQGYTPIIPHTMYHGVLNDKNPAERQKAIESGKQLLKLCSEIWVFGKAGAETNGMRGEITEAQSCGIPIKYIDGSRALEPTQRAADLSRCLKHYESNISGLLTSVICYDIQEYLDFGISADVICECIDLAARKGAKYPYVRAILERCKAEKVCTLEEFNERCGKPKQKERSFAAYDIEAFERMLDGKDNGYDKFATYDVEAFERQLNSNYED